MKKRWSMVSMLAGVGIGVAAVTMMRQINGSVIQKVATGYFKDELRENS